MAVIRIPEDVAARVWGHLGQEPERFAFLLARWTRSSGEPVFLVDDAYLVPPDQVRLGRDGAELETSALLEAVNRAVRSGQALIECHSHGGALPRFSSTDRRGLAEVAPYVVESLPGRPYGATVWGDERVWGEYFDADGRRGVVRSVAVAGTRLRQLASRDDDLADMAATFDRQVPFFTVEGQRELGRFRIAICGEGGLGTALTQDLVYMGARDFLIIEFDRSDATSANRLLTAAHADLGSPKGILARRLVRSVAPDARVSLIERAVQSAEALDALKGVDLIMGAFDNDGARLVVNELAVAYAVPYVDAAVGIEVVDGRVVQAGGRVVVVRPGGPCLNCLGEIDTAEARYFLASPNERRIARERGYVHGMDAPAPAVVSLNAAVAAAAVTEIAIWTSGLRPISTYLDLDFLGVGRAVPGQWQAPRRDGTRDPGCVHCALADAGDSADIERYARERLVV